MENAALELLPMDKITAILMLRNENRYIYGENDEKPEFTMLQQQFKFLESFVDHIIIADGNSTDGSRQEYINFNRTTDISIFQQPMFDENLIMNQLLDAARNYGTKWVLSLDGDEILEDSAIYLLRQFMDSHDANHDHTVRFNYINLWRSRKNYRVDKWHNTEAGKFFSLTERLCSIGSSWNNHHFSFNSNHYDGGNIYFSNKKLLHYAWVDWNHILKKHDIGINLEMEHNNKTFEESCEIYKEILNEEGIILQPCLPEWAEEYRTGKIRYAKA